MLNQDSKRCAFHQSGNTVPHGGQSEKLVRKEVVLRAWHTTLYTWHGTVMPRNALMKSPKPTVQYTTTVRLAELTSLSPKSDFRHLSENYHNWMMGQHSTKCKTDFTLSKNSLISDICPKIITPEWWYSISLSAVNKHRCNHNHSPTLYFQTSPCWRVPIPVPCWQCQPCLRCHRQKWILSSGKGLEDRRTRWGSKGKQSWWKTCFAQVC